MSPPVALGDVPNAATARARAARAALLVVTGLAILWTVFGFWMILRTNAPGGDMRLYQDAALRWLHGGGYFWPYQLAGPYVVQPYAVAEPPVLYPPIALALFVPAILLPPVLWYAIPLGVTAWIVVGWHPTLPAWALIAVCAAMVPSIWSVVTGNPVIWVLMAVALSTRWPAAAALVLLKPSLFPFALLGIRHRGWWVAVVLMAVVSLVTLPLLLDWIRAVLNASGDRSGLLYSIRDVPLLLIPLIARLRSTSPSAAPARPAPAP